MKSTGLFGKNSGRVGGVVYSNYRGQQIVRSYQPNVRNPKSYGQIAQRAKFKLVSQVAASLSSQIKLSYVPTMLKETARNAWMKEMFKKVVYSNSEAALPIEALELTNSKENWVLSVDGTTNHVSGTLDSRFDQDSYAPVRVVFVGYNQASELSVIQTAEVQPNYSDGALRFDVAAPSAASYSQLRALVYAYDYSGAVSYTDYEVEGNEVTLDVLSTISLGSIVFSSTVNVEIERGV